MRCGFKTLADARFVPAHCANMSRIVLVIVLSLALLLISCGKKEAAPQGADQTKQQAAGSGPTSSTETNALLLPLHFDHHTGDLDEMVKERNIRALVILNPIGFFYDKGRPRGAIYESLEEFQKFANKKLKTGTVQLKVTYLPVAPPQAEAALSEGMGDFIANAVAVTPEREKRFAFSVPVQTNVDRIVVSGPGFGSFSTLEELAGKEIYVNPLTIAYQELRTLNDSLQKAGKKPIHVREADKNLTDDDLVQMVNADLIPATITTRDRAELWSKVFDNLRVHADVPVATGGKTALVMRKNNPQLKLLVDEFVASHGVGTSFGNTILRRYLKNTKWVKNSTSGKEMEKFRATIALFQKYATQYDFDYLMLAAQGYQESMLNQHLRSPRGAVGIMQVIPRYAAASPINIANVNVADANIHAGAKMLRNIADSYFNDPKLDPVDRTMFVFASYNAGPTRVSRLRKKAAENGLNPDVWFDNVELMAAQDIGQETVTYVRNIYKYYVAYKLASEQKGLGEKTAKSQ
jgi:membrane-bound lytic murein transglycosylase MltF